MYLSREELRKIELAFGLSGNDRASQISSVSGSIVGNDIDYMRLSQELGLHKQSLDFIKVKSQRYIDSISKFKDNTSTISKSELYNNP